MRAAILFIRAPTTGNGSNGMPCRRSSESRNPPNCGQRISPWEAPLTPSPILKVLSSLRKNGVRYLLMGGQACVVYGGAEFSRDTDIVVVADHDNLRRLKAAVAELQAEVIAIPPFEANHLQASRGPLDTDPSASIRCGDRILAERTADPEPAHSGRRRLTRRGDPPQSAAAAAYRGARTRRGGSPPDASRGTGSRAGGGSCLLAAAKAATRGPTALPKERLTGPS